MQQQIMPMPATAAPTPISAIPPHLQASASSMYRTTTPPSSLSSSYLGSSGSLPQSSASSSSNPPVTHTPTPPYGYANANGQGSSVGVGAYGAYGQQGYGGYQQQQQQQQQYQQYQQGGGGGYAGYPGYPAQPAVQPVATSAGVGAALPDALAGIPEEQKVGVYFVCSFVCGLPFARFSFVVPNLHCFLFRPFLLNSAIIKRVSNPLLPPLFCLGSHHACPVNDDGTAQPATPCGPSDVYTNCEFTSFPFLPIPPPYFVVFLSLVAEC